MRLPLHNWSEASGSYSVNKTWVEKKSWKPLISFITALFTSWTEYWPCGRKLRWKPEGGVWVPCNETLGLLWTWKSIRSTVILPTSHEEQLLAAKPVWEMVLRLCFKLAHPANIAFISSHYHSIPGLKGPEDESCSSVTYSYPWAIKGWYFFSMGSKRGVS